MKLSEAIRLGAMLGPQRFDGKSNDEGACALEGAARAAGLVDWKCNDMQVCFPILLRDVPYPSIVPDHLREDHDKESVEEIIWVLNDSLRCTREQTADWVETLETPVPTGEVRELAEAECS